ncbi:MAG TPA: hypothetical protein DCZ72_05755 [Armatimonadetes bacterium]|nr:hypothetical protein [Armatimonadota bacterium]
MKLDRFTACSIPLIGLPLGEALQTLADAGWQRIDLLGRMPHFSADPAEQDIADVEAAAAAAGVTIANLGTYLGRNFHDPDPAVVRADMELGLHGIERAARLGCRTARVLPGRGDDPAQIPVIAPHFAELAKAAEQAGIYLVMENHAGSIAGDPGLAVQLCEAVDSEYFGVIFEPANLLMGRVDYWSAYGTMRRWVHHVHFKDGHWVDGKYVATHYGDGDIRIAELVALLDAEGYTGHYAVEYEVGHLEPAATGLIRWRQWLEAL